MAAGGLPVPLSVTDAEKGLALNVPPGAETEIAAGARVTVSVPAT